MSGPLWPGPSPRTQMRTHMEKPQGPDPWAGRAPCPPQAGRRGLWDPASWRFEEDSFPSWQQGARVEKGSSFSLGVASRLYRRRRRAGLREPGSPEPARGRRPLVHGDAPCDPQGTPQTKVSTEPVCTEFSSPHTPTGSLTCQ